jgi:hypothetical protein
MFRFVHSSDLHIGKRFGNLPEDLHGRLRGAAHGDRGPGRPSTEIRRDYHPARQRHLRHRTPAPAILWRALAAMRQHVNFRWALLPGNHDSLQADDLRRCLPGATIHGQTLLKIVATGHVKIGECSALTNAFEASVLAASSSNGACRRCRAPGRRNTGGCETHLYRNW